jgi:hypothetical protein
MTKAAESLSRTSAARSARSLDLDQPGPIGSDRLHTVSDEHWTCEDFATEEPQATAADDPWDPSGSRPTPAPRTADAFSPPHDTSTRVSSDVGFAVAADVKTPVEAFPEEPQSLADTSPPAKMGVLSDSARPTPILSGAIGKNSQSGTSIRSGWRGGRHQGNAFGPSTEQLELQNSPTDDEDWANLRAAEAQADAPSEPPEDDPLASISELEEPEPEISWVGADEAPLVDGAPVANELDAAPDVGPVEDFVGDEIDSDPTPVEADAAFGTDADFDLYDFDEDAQQPVWQPEPEEAATEIRRAREKAAAIVALLDMPKRGQQTTVLEWLTEFFEHLFHPATYRAISTAAQEGLTPELLHDMIELRRVWMQRPEWWVGRWGYRFEVQTLRNGESALTWLLARQICRARSDYASDAMIDDDWLEEWHELSPRELGFMSFPSYIAIKIQTVEAETLDSGLRCEDEWATQVHLDDSWHRFEPLRHDLMRLGFRMLTPYDEHPGQLTHGPKEKPETTPPLTPHRSVPPAPAPAVEPTGEIAE